MIVRKLLLAMAVLWSITLPAKADTKHYIAVAMFAKIPELEQVYEGMLASLEARGYSEGDNITIQLYDANSNIELQNSQAEIIVASNPSVIAALSTPTAQSIVARTTDIPVVFSAVTDPINTELIDNYASPKNNVTGVGDASPINQVVPLIKQIIPEAKTLGVIYNPTIISSQSSINALRVATQKDQLGLIEEQVLFPDDTLNGTKKLFGKIDALYLPNDATLFSEYNTVIEAAIEQGIPIFTSTSSLVEDGALATVVLDYSGVGWITGDMVADILGGAKVGEISSVQAADVLDVFSYFVNNTTAKSLGIILPDTLLKKAYEIFK